MRLVTVTCQLSPAQIGVEKSTQKNDALWPFRVPHKVGSHNRHLQTHNYHLHKPYRPSLRPKNVSATTSKANATNPIDLLDMTPLNDEWTNSSPSLP